MTCKAATGLSWVSPKVHQERKLFSTRLQKERRLAAGPSAGEGPTLPETLPSTENSLVEETVGNTTTTEDCRESRTLRCTKAATGGIVFKQETSTFPSTENSLVEEIVGTPSLTRWRLGKFVKEETYILQGPTTVRRRAEGLSNQERLLGPSSGGGLYPR